MADNLDLSKLTPDQQAQISKVLKETENADFVESPWENKVESKSGEVIASKSAPENESNISESAKRVTQPTSADRSSTIDDRQTSNDSVGSQNLGGEGLEKVLNDGEEFNKLMKTVGAEGIVDMVNKMSDKKE